MSGGQLFFGSNLQSASRAVLTSETLHLAEAPEEEEEECQVMGAEAVPESRVEESSEESPDASVAESQVVEVEVTTEQKTVEAGGEAADAISCPDPPPNQGPRADRSSFDSPLEMSARSTPLVTGLSELSPQS